MLTKGRKASWSATFGTGAQIENKMIVLKKNESFPEWIQIFAFGAFIEEVKGRAKAMRIATKLAKKNKLEHVNQFGKAVRV